MIRSAPFSFILFVVVGATAGYAASTWYYSKQISDKDGQISRYQVALGIKPGGEGTLAELTNKELAVKAQAIVIKLRDLDFQMNERRQTIQAQLTAGRINSSDALTEHNNNIQETSKEFDDDLASDAYNIYSELYRRLDPKVTVNIMPVVQGTAIPAISLSRGQGFDAVYIPALANGIEQMAKLLPPDSEKP